MFAVAMPYSRRNFPAGRNEPSRSGLKPKNPGRAGVAPVQPRGLCGVHGKDGSLVGEDATAISRDFSGGGDIDRAGVALRKTSQKSIRAAYVSIGNNRQCIPSPRELFRDDGHPILSVEIDGVSQI